MERLTSAVECEKSEVVLENSRSYTFRSALVDTLSFCFYDISQHIAKLFPHHSHLVVRKLRHKKAKRV